MTDTVVAEGQVKFRDGKKWKTRWLVLRKPSPVADCLSLLVYKQKKKGKEKGSVSGQKERLSVTLEGICGVEPGPGYDGVSYTLSILCLAHTLVLGFSSKDALLAWDARVRYSLGEVHRFIVGVEPGTKLPSGPASLHLCNNLLVLTRGVPPVTIGHWKLSALRRYGAVPNGFVFEGGTRCGYWAGVFFLSCAEGEQISFLFDCIVRGIAPSRAPHGLRPTLPDLNYDPVAAEERLNQEASELEKRLSMISQSSLASSTASTYSCSTSVAGDDQTSLSSSSSSQSDTSYGGRFLFWAEPSARPPHLSNETASSSSTLKALSGSDDGRLCAASLGGCGGRLSPSSSSASSSSAQPHLRGLHDSGRQSSLDSGIGISAGSQLSHSGSLSSTSGSLEGGEEFGSAASLPPPPSSPPPPPPSSLQLPLAATSDSRCSSGASLRQRGEEYQVPSLLRLWYETPRSLLLALTSSTERGGANKGQRSKHGPVGTDGAAMRHSHSWGSERAPSVDSEGRCTPRPSPPPPADEETKCGWDLDSENYITPQQWQSVRERCWAQVPPSAHVQAPLCVREEDDDVADAGDKPEGLTRSPPPSVTSPPPAAPSQYRPASGTFLSTHPPACPDIELRGHCTAHYVNVPNILLSARASRKGTNTEQERL
ncbi:protein Dok-7 isoform X2 [Nelusetta ayraudi]|uniref:protein Dok-7 isoform X2 n=1 Tax=Nelusetta ayraudi TaxID=303726 RepID=UPI003F6FA7A5